MLVDDALGKAITSGNLRRHLQCQWVGIDGRNSRRPTPHGCQRKRTNVREHVQHRAALSQLLDTTAEGTLVEVVASLLTQVQGDGELEAALAKLEFPQVLLSPRNAPFCRKMLGTRRAFAGAVENASRPELAFDCVENSAFAQLHAERGELYHDGVAIFIDHEPRKVITLAVDDAKCIRALRR